MTFKAIMPFRLTKRHSTSLLYTDLGRPRDATRPKRALVYFIKYSCTKIFIEVVFPIHFLLLLVCSKQTLIDCEEKNAWCFFRKCKNNNIEFLSKTYYIGYKY